MKFVEEFKKFAFKGNVVDMAVGVIIGGAFGKIVTSLVNDVIMPIFGYLTAGMDFKELKWVLSPAILENGNVVKAESALLYGSFLQNVLDFFIIAISIFFMIRLMNRLKEMPIKLTKGAVEEAVTEAVEEAAPPAPTTEELLTEIRDLLKAQAGETPREEA